MEFESQFIQIGNIQIRYYGIIIVAAMLAATAVAARLAQRTGKDPEHVYGALTWAIIPGIIFARLWFVFFPPETSIADGITRSYLLENFFDLNDGAIAIWSGGLSIFGALLGGFLGVYLYFSRWHNTVTRVLTWLWTPVDFALKLLWRGITAGLGRVGVRVPQFQAQPMEPFPASGMAIAPWLDIAAVVLPLAQAIGRWANYVNKELYGTPTGVSWWGLDIPVDSRPEQYRAIEYFNAKFHPLFLYEAVWSLAAFFVLLYIFNHYRSRLKVGDLFLIYVAQYSFIRFWLEFLRVEVTTVGGINLSQLVTLIAFIVSLGLLFYRNRVNAPAAQAPATAGPQTSENG